MVKFFIPGIIFLFSLQLLFAQQLPQDNSPAYRKDVVVFRLMEEGPAAPGARTKSPAEPLTAASAIARTLGAKRAVSVVSQSLPATMQQNSRTGRPHPLASLFKLELEAGQEVYEVIAELQKSGQVAYAEPYYLPQLLQDPNDEYALEGGAQRRQLEIIKALTMTEMVTWIITGAGTLPTTTIIPLPTRTGMAPW